MRFKWDLMKIPALPWQRELVSRGLHPLPSGHKVPLPVGKDRGTDGSSDPTAGWPGMVGMGGGGLHFSHCPQHSGALLALNAKDS